MISSPYRIAAATVNHNTSAYMELMLRSFFTHHRKSDVEVEIHVFDNSSTDDTQPLQAYLQQQGLQLLASGYSLDTENNSHGDVLRSFVQNNTHCTHYLFLDADVVFVQEDTIGAMLKELEAEPELFGIGPRLSWDGIAEIPASIRAENPDICDARLHPCCALIRNTAIFQRIVDSIGLSCATQLWAETTEFLDTFKLMTKVMHTHQLRHRLASVMVQHFFCVSYDWDSEEVRHHKANTRDQLLATFRNNEL
jgi:hypothetical protein